MEGKVRRLLFAGVITLVAGLTAVSQTGLVSAASSATVNLTSTQQVIRGFGCSSAWCGALSDAKMNTLYTDIGLSILRLRIAPNNNWSSGNYSVWADELSNAKKAKARGAIVFATPWTAPAAMKTNNNVNKGSLKTASYSSYANYLKTFANYLKNNGAALHAISLQNEPDWEPDYEGCKWTAAQFRDFLKANGSIITGAGVKIIMPESLGFNQALSDPTLNDTTAASYVSIVGGHLYGAQVKDYPLARNKGKELWMTEHLFKNSSSTADMDLAKQIHDCMTTGMMNAYVYWWINSNDNGLYNTSGVIQKRAYILGQFAKYVRNGYNRVTATASPQTNVYVSAYKGSGKVVVVAVNTGNSQVSQSFTLSNGKASTMSKTVTSPSQNMANGGTVSLNNGSFTTTLPAKSVTTFVGTLN